MDGPPALTLGFEAPSQGLMLDSPKKRSDNLVSKKMLARILIHSVYMSALIALQSIFNFLEIRAEAQAGATFTLFVFLQLFNAFNCRVVGSDSILKGFFNNKPMLGAFLAVSVVQVLITQLGGSLFGTSPLTLVEWLKIVGISSTVMLMSEAIKLVYRLYQGKTRQFGR